jgi:cystathionine gamma-synthase
VTSDAGAAALQSFWQHTGLIVSTRRAEAALAGRRDSDEGADARNALRAHLAALYECEPSDIFLAPTGMAAQCAALRAVMARSPGRPTVQLGFPYVDSLKLQQKFGHGAVPLHDLETAAGDLASLLGQQPLAACFCEIPCNPLLGCVSLPLVSPLLRQHDVLLVELHAILTAQHEELLWEEDALALETRARGFRDLLEVDVNPAEVQGSA